MESIQDYYAIIHEALTDYRKWWEGDDTWRSEAIDKALDFLERNYG